jgi:putative inorganic carbon (hco3(-)) transporter
MLDALLKRQAFVSCGRAAPALILSIAVSGGLLFWISPLAPLLLLGAPCAAALLLFLLQHPLAALYVALFIRLMPWPFPSDQFPQVITYAQNGAIALAFLAWMLHAPSQRSLIRWNPVYLLIALFIVWAAVTLLWAPDVIAGLENIRRYCAGLIFIFLVGNLVVSTPAIDGLMRVLAIIGWLIVILGLWTALFSGYHIGERLQIEGINANEFGFTLILMIPGAVWPVLQSSGWKRNVYLALGIVFILCTLVLLLLSGSRGSLLALAISFVVLCSWKPLRLWGIAGGALVACVLCLAPFLLESLNNRFANAYLEGGDLGGRDLLWKAALHFIEDHPLTGAGVANGAFELIPYVAALTSHYDHRDAVHPLPPHNPLLQVGCDTGIIGMFIYVGIIVFALQQFFRSRTQLSMGGGALAAYFPIVLAGAGGYLAALFKDGVPDHPTLFALLALLIIPSQLSRYSGLAYTAARRVVVPSQPAVPARHPESQGPL